MTRGKGAPSASRIYLTMLGSLVLIVASLAGGIIWYNSAKTAELAIVSADRLIGEISDKVLERVQLLYDPMVAIVALAARVPELQAMCSGDDPPALPFLLRGLRAYPQIFSLYVGFADGEFFMVSRVGGPERAAAREALGAPAEAEFANERIRIAADGTRQTSWRFLDHEGKLLDSRNEPQPIFDPRERVWYNLARAHPGDVQRTQPYQFASSKEMGVTLSRSVEGRMDGAFGADLAIGEISRFLAAQAITKSSRVFIFDGDGTIVAPSMPGKRIADSGDPVMTALYERFRAERAVASLTLTVADRAYEARIRALPERYGSDEYLAILVPTEEILEPTNAIRTLTLLYSSAFLVLALPLYATLVVAWIDRRLARHAAAAGLWQPEEEPEERS